MTLFIGQYVLSNDNPPQKLGLGTPLGKWQYDTLHHN